MTQSRTFVTLTSLTISLLLANSAHAKIINCWYNKADVRECGSSVPPEFIQLGYDIVKDGLIIERIPAALTPKEKEEKRERDRIARERADRIKEQARLDSILLNAYTTERDLLLARDTNLKAAQGQIDIATGNLRLLQSNYDSHQKHAANFERTGEKPPTHVLAALEKSRQLIKLKKENIEDKITSKKKLQARFTRDINRFRKLKSGRLN